MEPLATLADYEARHGPAEDPERVSALLGDATAYILAQGARPDPSDEVVAVNLARVCCSVAARALSAGGYAGLESVSQGADGYTASVKVYNPGGDLYLTREERRSLGIGGCSVGAVEPEIGRGRRWCRPSRTSA